MHTELARTSEGAQPIAPITHFAKGIRDSYTFPETHAHCHWEVTEKAGCERLHYKTFNKNMSKPDLSVPSPAHGHSLEN